jgi:arsenate reductase (thioredoxin)
VTTPPTVLFLCIHNAGRSQMALGWLRHLGADNVVGLSAGSEPAAQVNPVAVEAMAEVGIDITTETPQRWTEALLSDTDIIVTMGCGDTCPYYPGKRYEDWPLADPAGQGIAMVREVRDEIRRRVEQLLVELTTAAT